MTILETSESQGGAELRGQEVKVGLLGLCKARKERKKRGTDCPGGQGLRPLESGDGALTAVLLQCLISVSLKSVPSTLSSFWMGFP